MMRCLYVDDEVALLEVAKEYLEFEGDIGVEIVSSAKEALRMMSTYSYDCHHLGLPDARDRRHQLP